MSVARMRRRLILEDGLVFEGQGFGCLDEVSGEVVFTTAMSGYQQSITDQSYNGQCLVFTYPLIGNYGINAKDMESLEPTCLAVICKDYARLGSHYQKRMDLAAFLLEKKIIGLSGIDTRKLTRHLRQHGTMKGFITDRSVDDGLASLLQYKPKIHQIAEVSTQTMYPNPGENYRVVVVDYGLKHSILRELSRRQCDVIVVPHTTSAEKILSYFPDGVMLSNGPGDPMVCGPEVEVIRALLNQVPIFGICMGHQLLALALGCSTFKMQFGHRGLNHPVREIASGRIDFTSQNHGYAVELNSIDRQQILLTHVEINDGTVEGIRHRHYPAFSVQFHPDAAPGPHDGMHLFDEFMEMMEAWKGREKHG